MLSFLEKPFGTIWDYLGLIDFLGSLDGMNSPERFRTVSDYFLINSPERFRTVSDYS